MYKQTLDILMEDINDHNNIKETILKNQLKYHFTHKNTENKNVIDNTTVIVRRILSDFNIGNVIGIQPILDDDHSIISCGLKYNIGVATLPVNTGYPEPSPKDLETINLEAEINHACALEIESEITNEFVALISQTATELSIEADSYINNTISKTTISIANEINANWIITSPVLCSILQTNDNFKSDSSSNGHIMSGLMYIGTLNDDIKVYTTLYGVDNTILVGSKDPDSEDAPIVYAPKTMLVLPDGEYDTSEPFTPLMTRYGKISDVHAAKLKYRKISINFKNNS